jgi:hypothetical protein
VGADLLRFFALKMQRKQTKGESQATGSASTRSAPITDSSFGLLSLDRHIVQPLSLQLV